MSGQAQVAPHRKKSDSTFPPEGAEFVIVSSDEIRFGVTRQVLHQSDALWDMVSLPGSVSTDIVLNDGEIESASSISLLLKLARGDILDTPGSWPTPRTLFNTLQLAKKYAFNLLYRLGVAHCLSKLVDPTDFLDMVEIFCLACRLEEFNLAIKAVSAMVSAHKTMPAPMRATQSDVEWNGGSVCGSRLDPSTWSVAAVAGVRSDILWAFIRATRTSAPPNMHWNKITDIPAWFTHFLEVLQR